jgi:hypothetical protein
VDILALTGRPTASDFTFKVGNDNNPTSWATAPSPTSVTLRAGAGVGGSDRITIIWEDKAILKQWLQVSIGATANTGLAANDIFYFGNAPGECGNSALNAIVNTVDLAAARIHPRSPFNRAPVDYNYDYDRDSLVNTVDIAIARANQTSPFNCLQLITVP